MPSWKEAAAFSLHVYRDQDQPPIPDGWFLLMDVPEKFQGTGYFGAVYGRCVNEEYHFYDFVIAHRGTVMSWPDLSEDLELFFSQKVPDQFLKSVAPFISEVMEFLDKKYGKDSYGVNFTGHSLGALLAELSAAYLYKNPFCGGAMTFESPGSKPFILKLIQEGKLESASLAYVNQMVVTCNADVNAINSCFEHVGLLGGVSYVGYSYVRSDFEGYPVPPDALYFFLDFTLRDQHKMVKLYQYWLSVDTQKEKLFMEGASSFNWPVGIEEACHYYMTYEPNFEVFHRNYWDRYIHLAWENNLELQKLYNFEEFRFSESFIKNLLNHDSLVVSRRILA